MVIAVGLAVALLIFGALGFVLVTPSSEESIKSIGPEIAPIVTARPENAGLTPPSASSEAVKIAPSAIAKAEVEAPATATFELHTTFVGYETSYYALGVVTNTSSFVIGHPKINAILLDAGGKEVGTDFGFAEADTLGPGMSSAIKILINDPPEHDSVRYEVVVKKAFYVPKLVEGLRVEPTPPKAARYGKYRWELEGKVHHEGTQPAKFVKIAITALDAEGKLVGLASTFADGDVLSPGGMARYRAMSMTTAGEVDHFEFSVSGRPEG